jgi:uncharacterized phiE125 gp8 family phage protein
MFDLSRVRPIGPASKAVQVVSLEAAREQCRVDCIDEDTLLGIYIAAATVTASQRLQRALTPTRFLLTADAFPCAGGALSLLMPPVTSVDAVRYLDHIGVQQVLPVSSCYLDRVSEPAQLIPATGLSWPATLRRINTVEVEYTAGYAEGAVPEPIRQWILLAVADLYENRSRSSDKPVVPQQFADALLDPYRMYSL